MSKTKRDAILADVLAITIIGLNIAAWLMMIIIFRVGAYR